MGRRIAPHLLLAICVCLAALPLGSAAQDGGEERYQILLKSRTFVPKPGVEPAVRQSVVEEGTERLHVLLQLADIPDSSQRQDFESLGVWLLGYVPHYAWYASVPGDVDWGVPALAPVRWVGAIQPRDRLSPGLRERGVRPEGLDESGNAEFEVRFFSDVEDEEALRILDAHGAEVEAAVPVVHRYTVRCSPAALEALAEEDGIHWIDRGLPPPSDDNDGSRARTNVDALHGGTYDLSGQDVDLGQWESRVPDDHVDFGDRLTIGDTSALAVPSEHATHVAGTMAGDGSNSQNEGGTANQWKGMAPGADIIAYELHENIIEHLEAINTYGIELSHNSWGRQVIEATEDNCDEFGVYAWDAPDYDKIVTGLFGKRIVTVFSAGNERNDGDCGMDPDPPYMNWGTVHPPSTAKNVISVGATNSQDDTQTIFSSWGPLADGRLKPDVVAPGCQEPRDDDDPEESIWSTLRWDHYGGMCGTSMSAPVVSGISALLIEQFRRSFGRDPWPSTVKAYLIHTAVDLDEGNAWHNPGPDYASGYGRVDAMAAVDEVMTQHLHEGMIAHGKTDRFEFLVPPGTAELKVTLAWDDEPAMDGVEPALVNNLDLVLVEPNGVTTHLPWVLDPDIPSNPATRGVDDLNNVEQVAVEWPENGTWQVRVEGTTVPVGPQLYSLVGWEFLPVLPEGVGPLIYADHQVEDGAVEPGDSEGLYVWLTNEGTDGATGVSATISTSDPYVTSITDSTKGFNTIYSGTTVRNNGSYNFNVSASAPHGHIIPFDLDITADSGGPWSDSFALVVVGSGPGPDVALISDGDELTAIQSILDGMGLGYDTINDNWDGVRGFYTSVRKFLSYYDTVIWYASGLGTGRQISQKERDALEQYLLGGGNLLVTGHDTLGSPTDELLADVVRSSSSADGPFTHRYAITDGSHPITRGPYGSIGLGSALVAAHLDHDQAEADLVWPAETVAELWGGSDKVIATDLASPGGIVVYWNGNRDLADWLGVGPAIEGYEKGGKPQDGAAAPTSRDLVAAPEAPVVIDFDDWTAPCGFGEANPWFGEMDKGVLFAGLGQPDGGAVLDECSGHSVTGHSPPNVLAFDEVAQLQNGGVPADPGLFRFSRTLSSMSLQAGSGVSGGKGHRVTLEAFNSNGVSLGSSTATLGSTMRTLSVSAAGISKAVISSPAKRFVVDDLTLQPDGTGPGRAMFENTLHWLTGRVVAGDGHEPNDRLAACEPIPYGEPILGVSIDPAGDQDLYCFSGSKGQEIASGVAASVLGSDLDPVLALLDRDGTTVLKSGKASGNADQYLEYALPLDGVYYLRVRSKGHPFDGGATDIYNIGLQDISPGRSLPYFDDMEAGGGGWIADGLWHKVQEGVVPHARTHTPSRSWWYGLDHMGDYDTGMTNEGSLTSPPIDLPADTEPELAFWNWNLTDPVFAQQSVYFDAYHDTDGDNDIVGGIFAPWADFLTSYGFSVVQYDQAIDLPALRGYDVLALFDPELPLAAAEITAINQFMQGGGRVVALGDHIDLDGVNTVLNTLTAGHGIAFNADWVEDNTHNDAHISWPLIHKFARHPLVWNLGQVALKDGCSLSLSGAAEALATGDGDTHVLVSDQTEGLGSAAEQVVAGAPVVMAYAPVGAGGIVAIGDSDLWSDRDWDSDGDIGLDEYENAMLARLAFARSGSHSSYDVMSVQVSQDGGPFQDAAWSADGPMFSWQQSTVSLADYAGSTIRIRFHLNTVDAANNDLDGWFIDDIWVGIWNQVHLPLIVRDW